MSRYIDATEITEQIAKFKKNVNSSNSEFMKGYFNALTAIVVMIVSIRTADVVEVRHGEWKDRYENKYANHYYECSVCGKPALDRTVNNGLGNPRQEQALSSFCPNCGAKMDGERMTNVAETLRCNEEKQ